MTTLVQPSTDTVPRQRTVPELVSIMHNAAQVPVGDPGYARARAVMKLASSKIGEANDAANQQDLATPLTSSLGAGIVNFGQGATGGLAQTQAFRRALPLFPGGDLFNQIASTPEQFQDYLWTARQEHPLASGIGEAGGVAGGALLASQVPGVGPALARMGPVAGGATVGGVSGGLQSGIESGSVAGGITGAVAGAVGGAISAKALSYLPFARRIVTNVLTRLGGSVPEASVVDAAEQAARQQLSKLGLKPDEINGIVKEERLRLGRETIRKTQIGPGGAAANDVSERILRERLARQGYSPENIDKLVQTWRQGGAEMDAPAYQRTAARLGTRPPGVPTAAPSGVGNPPPNPEIAAQYTAEANARIARAQADAVRAEGFQQAAAKTGALEPPTPPLAAGHSNAEVPPVTQLRVAIRKMEDELGRELTPEERTVVRTRFLGPMSSRPGHMGWWGPGTFTP